MPEKGGKNENAGPPKTRSSTGVIKYTGTSLASSLILFCTVTNAGLKMGKICGTNSVNPFAGGGQKDGDPFFVEGHNV